MLSKLVSLKQEAKNTLNRNAIDNYSRLKLSLFFLPLFFLIAIVLFLYFHDALSAEKYVQIQKSSFLFINSKLSQFPILIYNLTQIGDALVFLSLLTILIVYAPKIWESLITASLVSAIFSNVLKNIFAIPRPAASFDNSSFVIIGKTLSGHNSLPSGHSITVFAILTVLLFAWMPKKLSSKIPWVFFVIVTGLFIVFTRVGVGAHYPLDVISGSLIGFTSGLASIFINKKYNIWTWINNKKYYPIFILLFLICFISIVFRIRNENLIIYYLSLFSLLVSLYIITDVYVKK
jgi:membrane-associated phospholipid phosphatase